MSAASTLSAPPDLCCRCDDVAPWEQWVDPKPWTDSEGRACEQRTCASCGCNASRVVSTPCWCGAVSTPCWCGAAGAWQVPPFGRWVCERHCRTELLSEADEHRRAEGEDIDGEKRHERELAWRNA